MARCKPTSSFIAENALDCKKKIFQSICPDRVLSSHCDIGGRRVCMESLDVGGQSVRGVSALIKSSVAQYRKVSAFPFSLLSSPTTFLHCSRDANEHAEQPLNDGNREEQHVQREWQCESIAELPVESQETHNCSKHGRAR